MVRILIILILLFPIYNAFAQDTIYFNKNDDEIPKKLNYQYYKIIQGVNNDTIERIFYKSDKLKSETIYSSYARKIRDGISKEWYENSVLKSQIPYKTGHIEGSLRTFWPNGNVKRVDIYRIGKCINGTCFDSTGVKINHFDYNSKPEYPGGDAELIKFVGENTRYPEEAYKNRIEGSVIIRFIVNKKGDVVKAKVLRADNILLVEEALRVVYSMPRWNPGCNDGEPVDVWFIIPVTFKL